MRRGPGRLRRRWQEGEPGAGGSVIRYADLVGLAKEQRGDA
ncbi:MULTISPECIES: hypothetical protein [Streptomyces]|uniref:Uncharacterized protein n=1 Tax=Streptomyces flaveolus TaxID=67297 RepID=A0ABV3A579_9ACTN|nr:MULTISPECIES: hypothetical protein [unclassified Streptomyces]